MFSLYHHEQILPWSSLSSQYILIFTTIVINIMLYKRTMGTQRSVKIDVLWTILIVSHHSGLLWSKRTVFIQSHLPRGLVSLFSLLFLSFAWISSSKSPFHRICMGRHHPNKLENLIWIFVSAQHIMVPVSYFSSFEEYLFIITFHWVTSSPINFQQLLYQLWSCHSVLLITRKKFRSSFLVGRIDRIFCCKPSYLSSTRATKDSGKSPNGHASATSLSVLRSAERCQAKLFRKNEMSRMLPFLCLLLRMHSPVVSLIRLFSNRTFCAFCSTSTWRRHGNQIILLIDGSAHWWHTKHTYDIKTDNVSIPETQSVFLLNSYNCVIMWVVAKSLHYRAQKPLKGT